MDLRGAAREWFNQGFNVVAVCYEHGGGGKVNKRPLTEWSRWQSRRQTEEEFEGQPWDRADGFGVVCSWPSDGGLYLAVVDFDVKKVSEEAKKKGEELFNRFPATRIERTVSGGLHKVYLSRVKPRPVSQYHDTHALELVAGPKPCLMAPSKGYSVLNGSPPRIVEDAEGLFYQVLGVEDARSVDRDINASLLQTWLEKLKPHLDIRGEGANYLYVRCPFHPPDNHPSFAIHKSKYYAVDYHDGKVYSLKDLAEALEIPLEPSRAQDADLGRVKEVWGESNFLDYVLRDLGKRIKRDEPTKLSVFAAASSAYLPEPINLFLKGESGIGKTYITVETLKYFPREDVWFLGGLSPKALIHDYGVLVGKHGEPLRGKPVKPKKSDYESEEEYKKAVERYREELKAYAEEVRSGYTLINMRNKILVFLEAPEYETFRMLYPILSHDTERIEYRFTDKSAKGTLRTQKVVIEGWPAAIFCSTDRQYLEELSTRSFTVTPESSEEKIEEANRLTNQKASFPWEYEEETEEAKNIKALILSLKSQLLNGGVNVVIPFPNLYEIFPKKMVRDMRDFQHFTQFLKAVTALHFYRRPFIKIGGKRFFVSSVEDVRRALDNYSKIFQTTRTGTEERILKLYHEIVRTKEAWHLKELTAKINESSPRKVSSDWVRKTLLQRLIEIGYVTVEEDEEDRRLNVYKPLVKEEKELEEIRRFLDSPENLGSKLEKGFEDWLKNIGGKEGLDIKNKIFIYTLDGERGAWLETPVSTAEFYSMVLGREPTEGIENFLVSVNGFPPIFSKPEEGFDSGEKPEKGGEPGFRRFSAFSGASGSEEAAKPSKPSGFEATCTPGSSPGSLGSPSLEDIQALLEAAKRYGDDFWLASDIEDDYARAGGRDYWGAIKLLSSREWLETSPRVWLEEHPRIRGVFRLRVR
jgi:hypothetical protein